MRGRPFRNPYRRVAGVETKTWLPDDAGMFTDPDAIIDGPQRNGHRKIVLPDGRKVDSVPLGSGEWTEAWKGEDGWVYLFTDLKDPTKELLARLTRETVDDPCAVHLPWVERIGTFHSDVVYRSPFYGPVESALNFHLVERLQRTLMRVYSARVPRHKRLDHFIANAEEEFDDDFPLVFHAVALICFGAEEDQFEHLAHLEFPLRNLKEDAEGNLVLLDVIFCKEEDVVA